MADFNKTLEAISLDSRNFFQTLFEQSPFSMQIFNIDGTTVEVNQAWEKLWQAKSSDAVGKYNICKDDQAISLGITAQFRQVLSGESVNVSDLKYSPALSGFPGRSRWIRACMYPLLETNGTVQGVVRINEDITIIKEQEEKYKSLIDFATEAIFVLQNEDFVFFNPQTLRMANCTEEEFSNHKFLDFIHPDHREKAARVYEKRIKGEPCPTSHQWKLVDKQHNLTRWVEAHSVRITWEGDYAVLVFLNDITDRKKVEMDLQSYQGNLTELVIERTKHLEALLTFSQELTGSTELQYLYKKVVSTTKNLLQFDFSNLFLLKEDKSQLVLQATNGFPESLVGTFTLMTGQCLPSYVAKKKKGAVVRDFKIEDRFYVPNIIFENNITSSLAAPMMNKGEVIGVLIGHTLQKREFSKSEISLYQSFANQAAVSISNALNLASLQTSEEKFRHLFENANDAIYLIDPETHKIIDSNRQASLLDGYQPNELQKMEIFALHPSEEQKIVERTCKDALEKKITVCPIYFHHLKKDGTRVPIEISPTLVEIAGKKLIMSIARDITERIKAEQEKERVAEKLRRSQKMEAIGLMAGGVAHDLNNILSGLVSYPQLLLRKLPENSPLRPAIETIYQAGNRAAAVSADLITVARGVASPRETRNFNEIISEFIHSPEYLQISEQHKDIRVETHFDSHLFNMSCSPTHISKILLNLTLNAVEAIGEQGQIKISTANRYIDKPLKRYDTVIPGEYVVLSVADNGPGISSTDMERIFEPFYSKKVMGRSGTGLGLAVVWNSVLDHDGYIDVASNKDGTVFELYFPATRNSAKEEAEKISFKELCGNGEKILVIDDVASQREIACEMLKELGYRAESVASGEEAVSYMKVENADLLILDMIMEPGMNGRETYEKIVAIRPGQKAIITSGFSETSEVKKNQALGAGRYIKKPYTLEQLALTVKEELLKG